MGSRRSLKSVRTCLTVVEILIDKNGCRVSELSEYMDKPKGTIFEYIRTLQIEGFVVKEGNKYKCSSKFLSLGDRWRKNNEIYNTAKRKIQELSMETGAHVSLICEQNGFGIVLSVENLQHSLKPIVHLGMPTYLHANAGGKAILANLPQKRIEDILEKRGLPALTENTITHREELEEDLKAVREGGFAVDVGESMDGVGGIGVPIQNREREQVVAAIALYGPSSGNKLDIPEEEHLDDILRAKNAIEVNLIK